MENIELDSNGFFIYKPSTVTDKREHITEETYTYNGVVLPPIPGTCRHTF